MENTYLSRNENINILNEKKTYINNYSYSEPNIQYRKLPEEYDIFSIVRNDLVNIFQNEKKSKQDEFIASFCSFFSI